MNKQRVQEKFWVVVPAAGTGSRMESALPKQYLALAGKAVIEHTLTRLASHKSIAGIVVAIAEDDPCWPGLDTGYAVPVTTVPGGVERHHSVLNGLQRLAEKISLDDWVMVHDAARPCLRHSDIDCLIEGLKGHAVGGLLGVPVSDTMKRADSDRQVKETVDRNGLWHAMTPQMFRLGELVNAIEGAIDKATVDGLKITDEASAMELLGRQPMMIEGHADNIKITRPQDLMLAELYLRQQLVKDSP